MTADVHMTLPPQPPGAPRGRTGPDRQRGDGAPAGTARSCDGRCAQVRRDRLAAVAATRALLWLGPGWHLLVDETRRVAGPLLRDELRDEHAGVDVSAARTILQLKGPHASAFSQHGCTIDLHPRAFGIGSSAQTNLAQAQVILHRHRPRHVPDLRAGLVRRLPRALAARRDG